MEKVDMYESLWTGKHDMGNGCSRCINVTCCNRKICECELIEKLSQSHSRSLINMYITHKNSGMDA